MFSPDKTLHKGRAANSNPANRFSSQHSVFFVQSSEEHSLANIQITEEGCTLPAICTEVQSEQSKSIISKNESPDVPFNQSINPYRGCEHGCIYCYARPSHNYLDLSAGLDFETKLYAKENAALLLAQALNKPGYRCKPITLGANTDCYQPIEKNYQITRQLLEVLQTYQHPFTIITKGNLILRDLDILGEMAKKRLCSVMISLTTLDNDLKRSLEPRAASPESRLRVIRALSNAGVPVGILIAPVIPHINDHELEKLLEEGAAAGARNAAYLFLRLPHEVKPLFGEWLKLHYPRKASHVLSLIRQSRNGQLYDHRYHTRMSGVGPIAEMINQRFQLKMRQLNMHQDKLFQLDCSQFEVPGQPKEKQLSLF